MENNKLLLIFQYN